MSLNLSGASVRELRPLSDLPLRQLYLSKTSVSDITPLAAMQLQVLDVSQTSVRNLQPVKSMPLRGLYLADLYVSDLLPVASCTQLEALVIPINYRSSLDFLRKMPNLKYLSDKMPPAGQAMTTAAEFWRQYDETGRKSSSPVKSAPPKK